MLYALGAGDDIVAVSHECDYPPAARKKPRVIRTYLDTTDSSEAIDGAVHQAVAERRSLYEVDHQLLARLAPDVIVTQQLCAVCAIDVTQMSEELQALPTRPDVIALHPHTLEDVFRDIQLLGARVGRVAQAHTIVDQSQARLAQLQRRLAAITTLPRVWCVEWLYPPMAPGHWVPEQVTYAGGIEVLGRKGEPSRYVSEEEIIASDPEVLILMPCGFSIERTRQELGIVKAQSWWRHLSAVKNGRVFMVDGPAYFNCAGPRLVQGAELLAGLFHPERCRDLIPPGSYEVIEVAHA